MDKEIRDLLEREAARINNVSFIANDPVQFPRRFERQEDIEIVSFISAMVAWGKRTMICRNIDRMLTIMNNEPYIFLKEEGYESIDSDLNLHRTFFGRHLKHFLKGLKKIYKDYGNLEKFAKHHKIGDNEAPAWKLVELINEVLKEENNGKEESRCLPLNLEQTALKRINMALRWLVRDDGIVDMGIWDAIPKSKLFIPLDVHVGDVSRELGLLKRKANDKRSVFELTQVLKEIRPEDPTYYDYALFGIGVENLIKKQ